ncbi:MAG: PqqD family protein [Candidatus Ventricola sp.]
MRYVKPEMHFVRCEGELTSEEILQLSDEELEEYLSRIGYHQAKKRYRIHPDFALREIAGEYAIVPLGETQFFTNAMMTPNKTAAFLWQAFSEPSTEEDVVMRALERFDGEKAAIRRDVEMFMKDTMKRQVLVEVD